MAIFSWPSCLVAQQITLVKVREVKTNVNTKMQNP